MTLAPEHRKIAGTSVLVRRYFTVPKEDPYDQIAWELRRAVISGKDGNPVFEQNDVEFPTSWSQSATNIVASKYFRGPLATGNAGQRLLRPDGQPYERERSVRQLVNRICDSLTQWGKDGSYFASDDEGQTFHEELKHLLVMQKACFNSPVWFNLGIEDKPQCSACFILGIKDSMDSILNWYQTEGRIFKGGSGSGVNLSSLRSSKERVAAGGLASGPVSFMRGADAIAGTIKSGGKTRRAAKMVVLNVDHPDIEEFIWSKAREEKKAYALGEAGWDVSLDGDAWISIQYQNANNSVRVSDEFMEAVQDGSGWHTRYVIDGEPCKSYEAKDIMRAIAQAAWECADPGVQYDTIINDWHTCPNTDRINASNPCSEYMHLDDSACNLASLNLLKFLNENGEFDVEAYKHAIAVIITAQEIIVSNSSYPTDRIATNTESFRQLGLGYTNLGALLMSLGIPYDSPEGRAYAAALTSLMTGHAYAMSARIAARVGPFSGYSENQEPMLRVIGKHRDASSTIDSNIAPPNVVQAAKQAWEEALTLGQEHGYRNSQATVIAPTGTISFMMDCDTTGIEPDIALVKYKTLVGGGLMKIVNGTVPIALRRLGYAEEERDSIVRHIDDTGSIEGAPLLKEEHLPVFDCAFKAENGSRTVHWLGHIKMMGAVQPFVSGAISKTVNLPESASVEEIEQAFIEGWRQKLKALAIYRDGSKRAQVLTTMKKSPNTSTLDGDGTSGPGPVRRRLPPTRRSVTHKFSIEGHEGYITAGCYDDGSPGEIFVTMAKEGSTLSGMLDAFATSISLTLQYGVPLQDMVQKFSHMRFEPAGLTENGEIPVAQSIVDYLFRWLASQFLNDNEKERFGVLTDALKEKLMAQEHGVPASSMTSSIAPDDGRLLQDDAPPCLNCGWIMTRCGTCYRCNNCGTTSGCG